MSPRTNGAAGAAGKDIGITRRELLGAAALASLPLSSNACSKGRTGSPEVGARKKVRLTYPTISVAKNRGVLEQTLNDQGIDVEWVGPYPNHAPTLQAVATDSADFSFGGSSTPAAQAIASGSKLTFVAWTVSLPRTTSIIVLPGSTIRAVTDLVGKTVAVNKAGVAEFLVIAALEKYGVPRDKVKLSYLNPPDAATAFATGQVDAWAMWTGPLELAEVQYGARRIFEEGKELDRQVDFGTYLVREEYAAREAETIRRVIKALQAEASWTNTHFAEALAMGTEVTKYPKAVVDKMVANGTKSTIRFIDDEGVAALQGGFDWLAERRVISSPVVVNEHAVRL
jgi:sulfonate transport system substrate-binding protein